MIDVSLSRLAIWYELVRQQTSSGAPTPKVESLCHTMPLSVVSSTAMRSNDATPVTRLTDVALAQAPLCRGDGSHCVAAWSKSVLAGLQSVCRVWC